MPGAGHDEGDAGDDDYSGDQSPAGQQRTGTTPRPWLTQQRVLLAQRLLERGDDTVASIAVHAGLGSPDTLRRHFTRAQGVTPSQYRHTFARVGSQR